MNESYQERDDLFKKISKVVISIQVPKDYFRACFENKIPLHKPIEKLVAEMCEDKNELLNWIIETSKETKHNE